MSSPAPRHLHAIYAGHWAGNLGDSAVFDVLDRALPPDVRLTMEVESLGEWRRRDATSFVQWEDRAGIQKSLQTCDAVLIPGTTIVTDLHAGEWPIAWIARSVAGAREVGRPVHAVGVGIYPSEREARSDRFRHEFAARIEKFSVRDARSREALLEAGVDPQRVVLGADLAWLLDRTGDLTQARAEMDALTGGRLALAVNVVHEDWASDENFYAMLASELDAIHAATGLVTVFLCNEIRDGELYDAAASRHVLRSMKSPAVLHPVRWMHPEDMIARLACCACAISMRYHFAVFAIQAGIPWVGFARGEKNRGLLAEFQRPATLLMGHLRPGALREETLSAWNHRAELVSQQRQIVPGLRKRADLCRRHLLRVCGEEGSRSV